MRGRTAGLATLAALVAIGAWRLWGPGEQDPAASEAAGRPDLRQPHAVGRPTAATDGAPSPSRPLRPARGQPSGDPAHPLPEPVGGEEPVEPLDPDDPTPLTEAEAEAAVLAGEAAFDAGDLAGATAAYTRVVEGAPDAKLAPFAAYKLAWCTWNAGDSAGAVVEMERALSWLEGSDAPEAEILVDAAQSDLERFRAERAQGGSPPRR